MNKQLDFYYYSGTGNTSLVMNEMSEVFRERNISVNRKRIEDVNPGAVRTDVTIGLAFPVAFQSTFPFIWDFFKGLPEAEGTEIFMVDTMMSFSGAIVGPLKKLLTAKGYACIGAREIIMPSNWFPKKIDEEANKFKVLWGLKAARTYADDLVKGKTSWSRIPVLPDLFYKLCCNDYMMENVNTKPGKKIMVDRERCVSCGLCAELCPVENITMKGGPHWSDKCQTCMRCLSYCPNNAVSVKDKKYVSYTAVKLRDLVPRNKSGA